MPNLLKSLPREILELEDSKFIYNVLNPLLFEKIKENLEDTIKTYSVSEMFEKDIYKYEQFDYNFRLPYNIDSRSFSVYMTDGQEKLKLENYKKDELINELDELKEYIFFYFSIQDYNIIKKIIEKYYTIKNEVDKNKNLYTLNYNKYISSTDVKNKKVFKTTFEYFKGLYDEYNLLLTEFDVIFYELLNHNDYSINQLVDNMANSIANIYKIKSFDNDIIFQNSKLLEYLSENITITNSINKYIFSGKEVIETKNFAPNNIFEIFAIFAMELTEIKLKYAKYLQLLVENKGFGYSLKRSPNMIIKNQIVKDIELDLESDNLTYFIDEENNKLEIYMYFDREFRIEEPTLRLYINSQEYNKSIVSNLGYIHDGYVIFEYFDDSVKYYKITINNYLKKDSENEYVNYDITDIIIKFDVVKALLHKPDSKQEPMIATTGFLDNFKIYKKNTETGFYEIFDIPYKIKIDIDEKEERYNRIYEFLGINSKIHLDLIEAGDIIISCYSFDYMYEPKIYVDFFKSISNEIEIRYNTIIQYTLIDDIMQKDVMLPYYSEFDILMQYNTDISKNVLMYDGKVYKKLFNYVEYMQILNPYNETNNIHISKISYEQLEQREHVRDMLVKKLVEKIPFYSNLKYIEPFQYDKDRNCFIIFNNGKQFILPLNEQLDRGLNYEKLTYDAITKTITYDGQENCSADFIFNNDKMYIQNTNTSTLDDLELSSPEMINLSESRNRIYYDLFDTKHAINIDGIKYNITNLYIATNDDAMKYKNMNLLYVESRFGIPRYKTVDDEIFDVDFNQEVLIDKGTFDGCLIYDANKKVIVYKHSLMDSFTLTLEISKEQKNYHRLFGLSINSLFYSGNALPENTNKSFYGRENILNSLTIPTDIYNIGMVNDTHNNSLQHELLAEQMDLNIEDASKHNMEHEQYLMFKSSTASFKGLETYLKSNLKSISQDLKISPVYLVQRNRFISEWARVSTVLPNNIYIVDALKDLVEDLMETKLINGTYDDLIDIFKSNEYEKFSLKTNDIHSILLQYIIRYLNDDYLFGDFNYYLIHYVWLDNNRKKFFDYIKLNASQEVIKIISTLTFKSNLDKEKLFYLFVTELEKENKITIDSYKPIANYSDWIDYQENNHVKFEKPFRYEYIDIGNFITMPIDWKQPLILIRPLVDDGVYTVRDYRFLDMSIATNSQILYNDAYNEYVEDVKNKINKPVNYLFETLKVMQEISLEGEFDFLSINLVIVKWIVERFLPNYLLSKTIDTFENFKEIIKNEILSVEHPNMLVSYNRIKESTLLRDLGSNTDEIYDSIVNGEMVRNSFIRLDVTNPIELEYLDKIKKPIEHYFDFLFYIERYDIIAKVLALFTEDVIASSMLDLAIAINIKNTKGDETFDIYEQMVMNLFDEFLPFHTVLDKIIFTLKIMETSNSDSISKQADVEIIDTTFINIVSEFVEKVRIQTNDRSIISTKLGVLFPSEGLKLCGGHDEIPYDYDRKIKVGGHDMPMHMDDFETYGVDDDFYIVDRDAWKQRPQDIYTPAEFADLWWECIPDNEFEKIVDVYIEDYYHIKQEIFERDNRIESYFVDSLMSIGVGYNLDEQPDINITDDYLISIDTTFNIRFYDIENIAHDEFGLDETWGPEDQSTLIGAKEAFYQNIIQEFYEKINVSLLDSIWTDIKILYDMIDIPGHDDFGIDEYYHQRGPDTLDQDISVMVYDELLHQGFNITSLDMSDISLIDNKLAVNVYSDIKNLTDVRVDENVFVNVGIWVGRNVISFLTTESGVFIPPGHDEFGYDEYYHDSADHERIANMVDSTIYDALGVIRIDFGFMRMLPIDPYVDLINQKFYRANQSGSEWQRTKLKDVMYSNIRIFGKDIIRVFTMDLFSIDLINDELRRAVYNTIETDDLNGDYFASVISDSLIKRHIHHDFRENIVALEKYASVLDDESILRIFGPKAAQFERDELFELRIGDKIFNDIKVKLPVDRFLTKVDKDYLKAIKIEEEDFVSYKHLEYELDVRLRENLKMYYKFQSYTNINLNETIKTIIKQNNEKEVSTLSILDKVHYGEHHMFDISGMQIGLNDRLIEMWSNKIYTDSLVVFATEIGELNTSIDIEYMFKEERTLQPHDYYGHMGYTDESLQRSIESRLTDSLVSISSEKYTDVTYSDIYDKLMLNIHHFNGDYFDVIISDSLHTYIHIVKKPWIFPEFDEFGHNEYPHMYAGESDEFDITTELRDQLKIDANSFLYNVGALVKFNDNILFGQHNDMVREKLSVSMVDDLKVITIGFTDVLNVETNEISNLERSMYEQPSAIYVQDVLWYGYKLRDESGVIYTNDKLNYGFEDLFSKEKNLNITISDWLLETYGFNEKRINISFKDRVNNIESGILSSEKISVMIKETLKVDDSLEVTYTDDSKVNVMINDKVTFSDNGDVKETEIDLKFKDFLNVHNNENKLLYGSGKWFIEKLRGFVLNRMSIYDGDNTFEPDIMIDLKESFHEYTVISPFKDSLGINTYDRLKYGLLFREKVEVSTFRDSHLYITRRWEIERYGVNDIVHDMGMYGMEYPDDVSADNSFAVGFNEDFKVITEFVFKDTLDIVPIDRFGLDENSNKFNNNKKDDGIIISSSDNLMYGIGSYSYLWDAKEWHNHGYANDYETWIGHIPHDEFPYDVMEHQDQGDDLSHINTGVTENLLYGFNFLFKDMLTLKTCDEQGFELWDYQSLFKDQSYIFIDNRLESSWADVDDNLTKISLRKEQMKISYEFDDKIKEHVFTSKKNVDSEVISIFDIDTHQLIEQIIKYRIYETIDTMINSNLFTTSLFKFDDDMSLITDWKTKIDLYKEQSDGSVTKSMTLIKDKTSARIELLFSDVINTNVKDKLHGTYAYKPNEYLE